MAAAYLIAVVNAVAYGIIPIGLWWIITHYPSLRITLLGLFLHMSVVCVKSALRVTHPYSQLWDWSNIHTATAVLSAGCLMWTVGRWLWAGLHSRLEKGW